MRSGNLVPLGLAVVFVTAACRSAPLVRVDKIADIHKSPESYMQRDVHLAGAVVASLKVAGIRKGLFRLRDQSGEIWVVTTQATPPEDSQVELLGRVRTAFSIGGKSYGTVIEETKRLR